MLKRAFEVYGKTTVLHRMLHADALRRAAGPFAQWRKRSWLLANAGKLVSLVRRLNIAALRTVYTAKNRELRIATGIGRFVLVSTHAVGRVLSQSWNCIVHPLIEENYTCSFPNSAGHEGDTTSFAAAALSVLWRCAELVELLKAQKLGEKGVTRELHLLARDGLRGNSASQVLRHFPQFLDNRVHSSWEFLNEFLSAPHCFPLGFKQLFSVERVDAYICQECQLTITPKVRSFGLEMTPVPSSVLSEGFILYQNRDFYANSLTGLWRSRGSYLTALKKCCGKAEEIRHSQATDYSSMRTVQGNMCICSCPSVSQSIQYQLRLQRNYSGITCAYCARETLHLKQSFLCRLPTYLFVYVPTSFSECDSFVAPSTLTVPTEAGWELFCLQQVVTKSGSVTSYSSYFKGEDGWANTALDSEEPVPNTAEVFRNVHYLLYTKTPF